ncbi:hypothetical protein [Microbacterium aerolatum]|uniref:hypothetical protein n=1 Tax=Microbacterium aerolatum TaxID=153731 RepID=UPI00384EB2CB
MDLVTNAIFLYPLIPIIAVFMVLWRRNRAPVSDRAPGVIYLTQVVGATAAGWAALFGAARAAIAFRPMTAVSIFADVAPFAPWPVPVAMAEDMDSPYVMATDIEQVRVTVAQTDTGTQVLQLLGNIVTQLPIIAIGVLVVILCERIIRGAPFAASLVRLSWIGAGVFLVTGFVGQLLSNLAAFRLAEIAFELIRAESPLAELPSPVWPGSLDWWPLWGALALAVLAVLIRHGARLQKVTEGLV